MVQKIQIDIIDDLDGSNAEGTVRFALDGAQYEIDLNSAHATELRRTLARYIGSARKVTGTWRPARDGHMSSPAGPSSRELRDWARAHGIKVKARGRIPAEVLATFRAFAHQ